MRAKVCGKIKWTTIKAAEAAAAVTKIITKTKAKMKLLLLKLSAKYIYSQINMICFWPACMRGAGNLIIFLWYGIHCVYTHRMSMGAMCLYLQNKQIFALYFENHVKQIKRQQQQKRHKSRGKRTHTQACITLHIHTYEPTLTAHFKLNKQNGMRWSYLK